MAVQNKFSDSASAKVNSTTTPEEAETTIGAVLGLAFVLLVALRFYWKRKQSAKKRASRSSGIEVIVVEFGPMKHWIIPWEHLTGFDLSEPPWRQGGQADIFEGKYHGMEVILKCNQRTGQIESDFLRRELRGLSRCVHPNVVKLIGVCLDGPK